MKKTVFNGYVYDFSVDYDAIAVDDIEDIHKYLMKENNMICIKMFVFFQKICLIGSLFLSSLVSTTPLSRISVINQAFYPFSVKTSKYSGSCNNIAVTILMIFMQKYVYLML